VFKETRAKELIEANCHARLISSKLLLNDVRFNDKKAIHISYTEKKAFYRSFNAISGRVGRSASEEVVMHLIEVKYLLLLLYGTDACPTNTTDLSSLDITVKRVMIKLFCTHDNTVISSCMLFFGFPSASLSINV